MVQMFAILSGCEQSAKAVNLIGDGKRHDLYTAVGSQLGIDATRDELKESIMTCFYQSEFIPESLFGEDVGYFYEALERSLTGAWEVLELCRAAQACIGDSYAFKNPSGHDVLVRQTIKKDYKVESKTGYDWTRDFHFTQRRKEFGLKVNYKGEPNDRSIGANLAHVCDAWFANSVVDTCKHQFGFDVYHVFDQFFCSPKHMNRMRWVAREILAQLADSNYLQEALREITGDHTFVYTKRSNNLADKIRTADYFLS